MLDKKSQTIVNATTDKWLLDGANQFFDSMLHRLTGTTVRGSSSQIQLF